MWIPPLMIRLCVVLAYLTLALPLPFVLLDHELGLLTGHPAHAALDDHAWLDHAAGAGEVSVESAPCAVDVTMSVAGPIEVGGESPEVRLPSVRGPPAPFW